jgi:hypothetical protein
MTIEDVIKAKLSAIGPAYPMSMEVGSTIPGVSYQFIGAGQPSRHHGGTTKLRRRLQVSCWGNTYAAATTLADQVRVALDGNQDNIELITAENIIDFQDAESKKKRRIVEFFVYE